MQVAPYEMLSLTYLATRWHHLHALQSWPPDGTTRISHKVVHQMDRHSHFTFICIILSDRTGLYCFTAWADIHGNYSWVSWDLLKGSVCDENKKMNKTSSKTFSETHFDISVANFCDTGSNFFKKCTRGYLKKVNVKVPWPVHHTLLKGASSDPIIAPFCMTRLDVSLLWEPGVKKQHGESFLAGFQTIVDSKLYVFLKIYCKSVVLTYCELSWDRVRSLQSKANRYSLHLQ